MRVLRAFVGCLGTCLLLAAAPALGQAVQPLTLDAETTADELHVTFLGLDARVLRQSVSVGGHVAWRTDAALDVHKPPWDATPVQLHAELLLTPTGDPLQLRVVRGRGGQTRLRLSAGGKVVWKQQWLAGDNAKLDEKLPLRADQILTALPLPRRAFGKKALAFYYGWYGTPQGAAGKWVHWLPERSDRGAAHTPALGYYDSADVGVIAQQVAWAKQAGLDGFVLSWWNDPQERRVLERLLTAAEGKGFAVSVYLERVTGVADLRKQLQEIHEVFGKHPAWLRAGDRPVVFLYGRVLEQVGLAGLREVLPQFPLFVIGDNLEQPFMEVLDGEHTYASVGGPEYCRSHLLSMQRAARLWDKLLVATVQPGYDDSHIRAPGGIQRRDDGKFYASLWAMAGLGDWVIVTSWNEWHEGSEIEPSQEDGDRWLRETQRWIEAWKR